MLELLKSQTLCVNDLAQALEVSAAAVSQHLRVLRDADLVAAERRGYFVYYRAKKKTLAKWSKMTNDLLAGKE